jgi:DEAD/DEAH box helicase domain-containing protein
MNSTLMDALQELRSNPRFSKRITAWRRLPARPARYAATPAQLHPQIREALRRMGIEQLYSHQSKAIAAVLRGEDVAVVTGAASGKTLCYNLPVLDALLRDSAARALYLFPTKALAQDQLVAWRSLTAGLLPSTIAATYDGDTPSAARPLVRQEALVLISNPDMLHVGILGHHTRWRSFFAGLKYVVLDEMHTYRGLFGSHVANLLRRLRRVCNFYGSAPTFICCSATIANPQEFAQQLVGRPVTLVDDDGSPCGEKHFLLYNPPMVDVTQGIRRGLVLEAALVADLFLVRDLPTITFARGRLATELLLTYLRRADRKRGRAITRLRGYRGGYLPGERREIERGLRDGEIRAVVSTNALELGVDIGELSVCVLAGYPGTIASTWQQAGRAGRRRDVSAVVLVGALSPLDQYLLTHPQFLFGRTPERALLSPDNQFVLQSHLKCAAFELPLADGEDFAEGVDTNGLLHDILDREGVLRHTGRRWYWMSSQYPAQTVSLRTAAPDRFMLCGKDGEVIGQVDSASVPLFVYPGAIYLHEGQAYLVSELDWDARIARVRPTEVDYFTEVAASVQVEVLDLQRSEATPSVSRANADVRVCTRTTGYREIRLYTHEQQASVPLDMPEQELLTHAYWLAIHDDVVKALRDAGDWTIAPIVSYGPNWARQRQRARERDGMRCRHCGRPEAPGREHDVHHLRPFRTFDYRPGENTAYLLANRLSNLITLCPECHPRVEAQQAVQGTLEGLGNVLRALAPLHLMCDRHDLRLTTDLDFSYTRAPTVIVYDAAPGGVGFSRVLYELHHDLLRASLEWVGNCTCGEGCPACVGAPPQTGAGAKARVRRLLETISADL